ncbi:MAG: hypothetical protein ACLFTI_03865 [Anaerolineales bacterium]
MSICKTCQGEYTIETCLCPKCEAPLRRGEDFCQNCRSVVGKKRLCPRCKSDVIVWEQENFSLVEFMKRWGALGLLPSLGAGLVLLLWASRATTIHYLMTIFGIALSQLIIILLYVQRLLWREHKWAAQIYAAKFPSLPYLIGMMFLGGGLLSAVVIIMQQRWEDPTIGYQLAFAGSYIVMLALFTAGFTFLAIQDYLNQLEERVPQPIFANIEKLLQVVLDAAIRTLNLLDDTESQAADTHPEHVTDRAYEVIEASRIPEKGGIDILLREYKPSAEPGPREWVRETWRIQADRWGRIQVLRPARTPHRR